MKHKLLNFTILLSVVIAAYGVFQPSFAQAATYYVSLSGSDANDGLSESRAFRTINQGVQTAIAGDTVIVKPGNYGKEMIVPPRSGTSDTNRIVIKAETTGTVTIMDPCTSSSCRTGIGFDLNSISYMTIDGFEIVNYGTGIDLLDGGNGGNNIFRNNILNSNKNQGIRFWQSHNNVIERNQFLDPSTSPQPNCQSTGSCMAYGVQIFHSDNTQILNNYFFGKFHHMISFKKNDQGGLVKGNTFEGGLFTAVELGQNDRMTDCQLGRPPTDGALPPSANIIVEDNLFRPGASPTFVLKNAIHVRYTKDAIVRNNFIEGSNGPPDSHGIWVWPTSSGAKVYNNVIVNSPRYAMRIEGPVSLYNNDFVNTLGINLVTSGTRHCEPLVGAILADVNNYRSDSYSYTANPDQFVGPFTTLAEPATPNPQFSPDFRRAHAFRLNSTSPLVNAGTTTIEVTSDFDGIPRPQGSAYDIGAFEFSLAGPPPTQCSDSIDNDGDSLVDFPNDPGCSDALDNDETDFAAPLPNLSPTANAGPDQTITDSDNSGLELVILDGSLSTDSDGLVTSNVWREGATQIATRVTPQVSLAVGIHTITLIVTDDDGATDSDTVVITINPPATPLPPPAPPSSAGLMGYWKFDDGAGTTALDSSGNNIHGTLTNGPTWVAGKIGGALSFDGVDDNVITRDPADGSLDMGTGDFTLAAWFYFPTLPGVGVTQDMISKGSHGNRGYSLGITDNLLCGYIDNTGDGGINQSFCYGSPTAGVWHHGAAVFDRDLEVRIYLDGISVGANGIWPRNDGNIDSPNSLKIGEYGDSALLWFNGTLDDVRIYNRALSASEIAALASPSSIPGISSLDRLHVFLDRVEKITLTGSNLTGDFKVDFLKAGVPEFTFSSLIGGTTTLDLDFTTKDLSSVPIGEYTVQVTRTADGQTVTHPKTFVFTRLGDMWKSGATDTTEQKRDGKIDIFDVSRMLSKWDSTIPADLAEADINAGPGGVSSGKIDIFDANKLMANWNP